MPAEDNGEWFQEPVSGQSDKGTLPGALCLVQMGYAWPVLQRGIVLVQCEMVRGRSPLASIARALAGRIAPPNWLGTEEA